MRTNEQMHVSICLVIFNCKDYYNILLSQYFTIATIYFDSILVISYFNTTIYYYGDILIRHYFTTTLLYIHTYKVHFRQTADESCRQTDGIHTHTHTHIHTHTHTHTHKYIHTYILSLSLFVYLSVSPSDRLSVYEYMRTVCVAVRPSACQTYWCACRQTDRQTHGQTAKVAKGRGGDGSVEGRVGEVK